MLKQHKLDITNKINEIDKRLEHDRVRFKNEIIFEECEKSDILVKIREINLVQTQNLRKIRENHYKDKDELNIELQIRARVARKQYSDKWITIESKLRKELEAELQNIKIHELSIEETLTNQQENTQSQLWKLSKHQLASMLTSMDQSQQSLNDLKLRINKLNDEIEIENSELAKLNEKYENLAKERANINSILIGNSLKYSEDLESVIEFKEPGTAYVKASIEYGQAKILILEDEIKNLEYEIGILTVQKEKLTNQLYEYFEVYTQTKDIIKARCKNIQENIDSKVSGFIYNIGNEQIDSMKPSKTPEDDNSSNEI